MRKFNISLARLRAEGSVILGLEKLIPVGVILFTLGFLYSRDWPPYVIMIAVGIEMTYFSFGDTIKISNSGFLFTGAAGIGMMFFGFIFWVQDFMNW